MRGNSTKKTRRAPSQERSKQLVSDIEVAAAHVLVAHGYAEASTSRIAEKAGVSVGSVYQYFESKEAIFESLASRILSELLKVSQAALVVKGLSLPQRIEQFFFNALRVLAPYPTVLRHLAASPNTDFYSRLRMAKDAATYGATELLALHASEIEVTDRQIAARMLIDIGEGILINIRDDDDHARIAYEATRVMAKYCCTARVRGKKHRSPKTRSSALNARGGNKGIAQISAKK